MSPTRSLGPSIEADGVRFTVWSSAADRIDLCLFDEERESLRVAMDKGADGLHEIFVQGLSPGARYGLRAEGRYDPTRGLWFDPEKLLLDPYAARIDRPFAYDAALSSSRYGSGDTAQLMPKGVVEARPAPMPTLGVELRPERVIYELQVKAFTQLHPEIAPEDRGTLAALAHPAVIDHLKSLHVGAVELMPINAWIDERHLAAQGLSNAWGYNPVSYFALDPRLAPGGLADLRAAVSALHAADIAVFMDVVYNHNGEGDAGGPTLSFRGLDPHGYFRHDKSDLGVLVNDTGCGNTLNTQAPITRRLVHDSLRYFVEYAGIDGFRFDLAPVLGRRSNGFDPDSPLMQELLLDPVLGESVFIAEPWDVGPDGYQLGAFPPPFLEWNDRYRDDVRRFWRGDDYASGAFATRLAGSSDIFNGRPASDTRSVNFLASHDGFSLHDVTSYERRHNEANGEQNRDGHRENLSWNHGVEGDTGDAVVINKRRRDVRALLSTLFTSRGHIMLTAGDEFGRTQKGNNNAYAQDNETTWLDWQNRDLKLQEHAYALARMRIASQAFHTLHFLDPEDVVWILPDGEEKQTDHWNAPDIGAFAMFWKDERLTLYINRTDEDVVFHLRDRAPRPAPARSLGVDYKACASDAQSSSDICYL